MLSDKIRKVSVIALTRRKPQCLKIKLVRNPKIKPIVSETNPSRMNCNKITKGVEAVKVTDWRLKMVLNKMIDTISLTTPSPKIQEKSFG